MPFHYTKSFGTFATDYGMQEGFGLPDLYEGVVPVVVIDDKSEYVSPAYPLYSVHLERAAVAAVYSVVGLSVPPGGNACRLLGAWGEGNSSIMYRTALVDIRTANTTTNTPAGLVRGSALTTLALGGTTTVDPAGLDSDNMFYISTGLAAFSIPANTQLRGLILRPGEYVWFTGLTVNKATNVSAWFQEMTYPAPTLPAAI